MIDRISNSRGRIFFYLSVLGVMCGAQNARGHRHRYFYETWNIGNSDIEQLLKELGMYER